MVRKTMKDLDEEIVQLKNVMNDVKRMLDEVYKKYDDLEERVLNSVTDDDHGCSVCDKKFKNKKELQEHTKEHQTNAGPFSCEVCKQVFDEEWKLRAHKKSHSGIKCDLCEEKFRCKDLMEKHVKVVHENVKWFCYFYNNDKECPHGEKCIFLHEDAGFCRYKKLCERNKCMFKHETSKSEKKEIDAAKDDGIWELNEEECMEVVECVDLSGNMEATFCNPNHLGKSENDFETEGKCFKCTNCDYEAPTRHDLKYHEDEQHNWCWVCEKKFETRREFKVHHYTVHSSSKSIWD